MHEFICFFLTYTKEGNNYLIVHSPPPLQLIGFILRLYINQIQNLYYIVDSPVSEEQRKQTSCKSIASLLQPTCTHIVGLWVYTRESFHFFLGLILPYQRFFHQFLNRSSIFNSAGFSCGL